MQSSLQKGNYPTSKHCKKWIGGDPKATPKYVDTAQYNQCVQQCHTTQSKMVFANTCNPKCGQKDIQCHVKHCGKKFCTTKSAYMGN